MKKRILAYTSIAIMNKLNFVYKNISELKLVVFSKDDVDVIRFPFGITDRKNSGLRYFTLPLKFLNYINESIMIVLNKKNICRK